LKLSSLYRNPILEIFTSEDDHFRMRIALGAHSVGVISFQLVLMQMISFIQWYHFAYMIISIALLGFGAAGSVLAIFRKVIIKESSWLVPSLMSLSGSLMIGSVWLARLDMFHFDIYLLFVERKQFGILVANYLIYFLPFFVGALAMGILFVKNSGKIGSYYFSNLLGSGLGGVLFLFLSVRFFALDALPVAASFSLIGALFAFEGKMKRVIQLVFFVGGIIVLGVSYFNPGNLPISQYKSLSKTLLLPDARIVSSKPDVYGRIDVVDAPALRYAPSVSLSYSGAIPVKKNIFANGDFFAVIPHFDTLAPNIHDYSTEALPYVVGHRDRVLILEAGAGAALAHALQNGVRDAVAVTNVDAVKRMMESEFAAESNFLFHNPKVKIIHQNSRQYLFSLKDTFFDAIILPRMESFGGTSGLNAISENYLLTIEAFSQMWDILSDEGVISVTSWMDYPPRTTLKIVATLVEMLNQKGISDAELHLVSVRSWGTVTFLILKKPIDSERIQRIKSFTESMLFDPLLLPGLSMEERSRFNFLEDDQFFAYIDQIVAGNRDEFLNQYTYYIGPAKDDKPYFSRFVRSSGLFDLMQENTDDELFLPELGYLIVWITLIQGTLLAIILIILPLFRLRISSVGRIYTLVYFSCLGLGYMFVEIILIQRFILYFGHSLYAISAVISVMLIASGLGSLYSGKVKNALKGSVLSTFGTSVLILAYTFLLTPVLMNTIYFATGLKILIALLLISVPAFFMGLPFPSGIRVIDQTRPDHIPWAWGINAGLSVVATALATLIAVEMGFRVVMALAAALYLLAFGIAFTTFAGKNIKISNL
jgi:spermidine synthase